MNRELWNHVALVIVAALLLLLFVEVLVECSALKARVDF